MLQGTGFYKKFKEAFKILDNIIDYDTSKKDAQHILRDIDNIDVIPKIIYDENLNLFGEYENEKENTIKQELIKLKQYKKPEQKIKIGVVIGPEGGLEEKDVELLKQKGAKIVTLGNRILRTETVALNILSVITYELEQ